MEDIFKRTADAQPGAAATGVPHQDGAGRDQAVPAPPAGPEVTVVRRSGQSWRVGDDELPDLTSAMVLADLLAAEHPEALPPHSASDGAGPAGPPAASPSLYTAARLRVTVAQLEAALVRRVRVEQAIGIISERRRVPPRQAFELLRTEARGTGARVADLAGKVVESATNPLLVLPEALARPLRQPRTGGKSPRHMRIPE